VDIEIRLLVKNHITLQVTTLQVITLEVTTHTSGRQDRTAGQELYHSKGNNTTGNYTTGNSTHTGGLQLLIKNHITLQVAAKSCDTMGRVAACPAAFSSARPTMPANTVSKLHPQQKHFLDTTVSSSATRARASLQR